MPANEFNPRGYWEHNEVVTIHDQLLRHLGSSWDDVRALPADLFTRPGVEKFKARLAAAIDRDFAQSPIWG